MMHSSIAKRKVKFMNKPLQRLGSLAALVVFSLIAIGVLVRHVAEGQTVAPQPAAQPAANPAGAGSATANAATPAGAPNATAGPTTPVTVASVDDLKSQAFKAIRGGAFDRSSDLLAQAAEISKDPQIEKMAMWTKDFQSEEQVFVNERHDQFEKAVADVHLLIDHKMDDYAADEAARAYLLTDDKDGFVKEQWIADLIKESAGIADDAESGEQWLKAMRVYSDLGTLQPALPEWKDKLKLASRRARLLMVYAPDELKKLQDSDAKNRNAADEVLRPTTQPSATQPSAMATTQPSGLLTMTPQSPSAATTQPIDAIAGASTQPDDFRIDWHDETKGIQYDMLWDALVYADKQYYRDVNYQTLMAGGLIGLKAVVTTAGLQTTFPGLTNDANRKSFVAAIDSYTNQAKTVKDDDAEDLLSKCLNNLMDLNKKTVQLPEEVIFSEFADGAFEKLDPFSTMIWPYELEEFQKTFQGEFGGVGIQIQSDEEGNLQVVSPLEDTPAYKAGIKAGDIITQINGKNAKGISLDRAVKTITGAPGSPVTLTIRAANGTVKDYIVTRELIKVASIKGYSRKPGGGWDYFIDPEQKVAYVRLTNFTKTTSDDLDKALDDMKAGGAKAVILDLRYDPGGLLEQATRVVNKFVPNGVIVSTHADRDTPNPPTVATARPEDQVCDLPMIVLVNQYSASASEIVSGAIKDHQRALIVGERTFGKGSVQMLFPLDDKKAYLKLTTAHYYLPNGKCIHREENSTTWGVDPDVTLEMTPEQMRTAIDARQDMDVLHDADYKPTPSTQPAKKDLLSADPQLSAALLMLRLEVSGAQL
jgi:carboxyl-terminal processing protease